jgi:protein-S-isoprenylcysteine O-methyltransferase Ste14
MLFLFLTPEIVFALRPGLGWQPLLQAAGWRRQIGIQLLLLLAVPGVSAVMEFAERGGGTPIPYDPPQRLVCSGMYRYCANPMQMSCFLVMLLWAGMLQSGWLVAAAVMSAIYGAGVARWDESEDLAHRFGDAWRDYRSTVRDWRVRWRPYHAGVPARVYIAGSCGPCSELRRWIEARRPVGLLMVDAETLPSGSIRRMRYDPGDGSAAVEGVRALGRTLEHLNFGWAVAGASLRLPCVWQTVQLLMDASGLGPRTLLAVSRG